MKISFKKILMNLSNFNRILFDKIRDFKSALILGIVQLNIKGI